MVLHAGFSYRNAIVLYPLIISLGLLPFFWFAIADIQTGGLVIQVNGRFDVPWYQKRYEVCLIPFLLSVAWSGRALLSFLNERIVLTDTTIERYGCLGTVIFSAPLASIQGLRPRLVGNGIRAYKLVTDRGGFVCSDAMIQFKVFERRITDIRSRRTIETEPNKR